MNHKKDIQSRYNATAEGYDRRYRDIQTRKYQLIFKSISIEPTKKVLDIGCGTGNLFSFLKNIQNEKYGIDFSWDSLKKVQTRVNKDCTIQIICGDVENLPFQKDKFDLVLAITTLQNLPDPKKSLEEMKTVCKQDGLIVLSFLKKKFTKEDTQILLNETQLIPHQIINDESCEDLIVICRNKV
ncbi:MAG: methyltransferase domain-containing protein [Candidatus Helarchaeota archaeon]|nr:methyltransferase domain-containing protein [Candidatus Helarchaeota archaeon]